MLVVMSPSDTDPWQVFLAGMPPELQALHKGVPPEDDMPVGDRSVSRAEFLEVLADQVSASDGAGQRSIRPDRLGAGMLAAAWRHTVFRQARAVLALLDAGLEVEAQANARVSLEHAVALQELAGAADRGDAELEELVEQIGASAGRRGARQLDYLERLDAETGGTQQALLEAAREQLATRVSTSKSARTTKAMFDQLPGGTHLHSVYSRLSEATHPGIGSATPYLATAIQAGSATVPATPGPAAWAETAALLCWSCCAAEQAMLPFLENGSDLADRQVELLAKVGLTPG